MLMPTANHRPLSAIRQTFRRAARRDQKLDRRVRRALEAGDTSRADALTLIRLKSFDLKLVAALEMNDGLKASRKMCREELFDAACLVSAFHVSGEPVRSKTKRKKNGTTRTTHDFGILDRIGQVMTRIALHPYAVREVQLFQFAALAGDGRGPAAAIKAVFDLIERGFTWMLEIDIQNCYGSFNPHRLVEELPLPRSVTEAHVVPGLLQDTGNPVVDFPPAYRGGGRSCRGRLPELPQGGLVSSMAAAMVLGRILGGYTFSSEDVQILVWSDNILVAAKTRCLAEAAGRALRLGLSQEPAGPFTTTLKAVRHADEGVDWIGRRFCRRPDGRQLAVPMPAEMRAFSQKVFFGLDETYYITGAQEMFRNWLAGWRGNYRLGWPNCDAWTRRIVEVVAAKNGDRVIWNRRGGFVRLVTDTHFDNVFPQDSHSDAELSYWKEKVYYWRDIGDDEEDLPPPRPSIATVIRREPGNTSNG